MFTKKIVLAGIIIGHLCFGNAYALDCTQPATATEALEVLRSAVGLNALECKTQPPTRIAFANTFECPAGGDHVLSWNGLSRYVPADNFEQDAQDFYEVHEDAIRGTITANMGNCGRYFFNLYAWSREYLLPAGGDVVLFTQQTDDGEIELVVEIPATRLP